MSDYYNKDETFRLLHKVVDGKPESFCYADATGVPDGEAICVYREDGAPMCLVGALFDEVGLLPLVSDYQNEQSVDELSWVADHFTPDAVHLLECVQARQDAHQRMPWRKVIDDVEAL